MDELQTSAPGRIARVAGLRVPVGRRAYLTTGLVLMALKHGVETLSIFAITGTWLSPLAYLSPLSALSSIATGGWSDLLLVFLALWTLPFAWIGASMSVRRSRDAGLHPAWGLLFLVPFLNYLVITILAVLPTRSAAAAVGTRALAGRDRGVAAAMVGVAAGAGLVVPIVALSTLVLGEYGASLFLGGPFIMSALAGFLYNLRTQQKLLDTALVGIATQAVGGGVLLLLAFEGVICLAMAAPLAVVCGIGGALLGRALAELENPASRRALGGAMLVLPGLLGLEPQVVQQVEHMVQSEVVVDAPPQAVWDVVLAFPDIPDNGDLPWFFSAGVATPLRARIEGEGVGAVRHCEFTTGAFVEPVTIWDPPHRLAFDVVEQPAPMRELSPWNLVHAPHILDGTLASRRGEFELEALPGGRTRLVGRTWYTVDMGPNVYWSFWVDHIVHRIHLRVLDHIGEVSRGA